MISAQNNDHHLSTSAINEVDASLSTNSKGNELFSEKNNKQILLIEGRIPVQQTLSLTPDKSTKQISTTDIENSNQQVPKVKMREHSSKKKKGLRDLKSRISLPPELKNSFSFSKPINPNNQPSGINVSNKLKSNHQPIQQRSSYYHTNSLSTQTLNNILHQSNSSLLRLSPSQLNTSLNGQLSRNEQRLSMLDLGFGKIESYVKLEKLGEGKIICNKEYGDINHGFF